MVWLKCVFLGCVDLGCGCIAVSLRSALSASSLLLPLQLMGVFLFICLHIFFLSFELLLPSALSRGGLLGYPPSRQRLDMLVSIHVSMFIGQLVLGFDKALSEMPVSI